MLKTVTTPQKETLQSLFSELKEIRLYLRKFLLIIPEESLKEYKNSSQIKKDYLQAMRDYPSTGE